jgi:hypothetical protein
MFAREFLRRGRFVKKISIPRGQPPGVVISLTTDHHAVNALELFVHLHGSVDTAVDHDAQLRKIFFEPVHHLITQRRHFAVFFGRQALQPGVAGVHDESSATSLADDANKVAHKVVTLALVDADAVLHGDRHAHHIEHGFNAIGHQLRLRHQAGPESAALHTLAGAATVEVDLVIAPLLAQLGGLRQVSRLATTQLQGQRMLFGIEAQMPRHIAVQERTGSDHLGVEQRVAREQTVKVPAMPVRPIHHGRNAEAPRRLGGV